MRIVLSLAMLVAITSAADAADSPVQMQSLLDSGFRVVAANNGRLILQNDKQVFSCGPDASGREMAIGADIIRTSYVCAPLH
jgi:hypothetical protein